jgi:hypothetical protein
VATDTKLKTSVLRCVSLDSRETEWEKDLNWKVYFNNGGLLMDGEELYLIDQKGANAWKLWKINLKTGKGKAIADFRYPRPAGDMQARKRTAIPVNNSIFFCHSSGNVLRFRLDAPEAEPQVIHEGETFSLYVKGHLLCGILMGEKPGFFAWNLKSEKMESETHFEGSGEISGGELLEENGAFHCVVFPESGGIEKYSCKTGKKLWERGLKDDWTVNSVADTPAGLVVQGIGVGVSNILLLDSKTGNDEAPLLPSEDESALGTVQWMDDLLFVSTYGGVFIYGNL